MHHISIPCPPCPNHAPSMHHPCTIYAPTMHHRRPSLHYPCLIHAPSMHHPCTIPAPSMHHHGPSMLHPCTNHAPTWTINVSSVHHPNTILQYSAARFQCFGCPTPTPVAHPNFSNCLGCCNFFTRLRIRHNYSSSVDQLANKTDGTFQLIIQNVRHIISDSTKNI